MIDATHLHGFAAVPALASQLSTPLSSSTLIPLIPWVPLVWAAMLFLVQFLKRLNKRCKPKRIRLEEDEGPGPRQKPLFAVWVDDEDILEAEGAGTASAGDVEILEATTEAILPPPPVTVALVPLLEVVGWASILLAAALRRSGPRRELLLYAGHGIAWAYALCRQLWRRTATAPLALLSLYLVMLLESLLAVLQDLRMYSTISTADLPALAHLKRLPDLFLICLLISVIFQMPLSPPLDIVIRAERAEAGKDLSETPRPRSPEDSNTVWGAFTYSWMSDIMQIAKSRSLRPIDVWSLSLNNRAEVLSRRFASLRSKTLTRKLLRASTRDIAIDASLKLVASTSEYLRPYFIQKILENLTLAYTDSPASATTLSSSLVSRIMPDSPPWTPRERAYLYTFLAFLSALLKTLAQQRHFHYARRIGMRLRSELTVALFEKALKRREKAGVEEKKADKGRMEEEPEQSAASVGKIITMISEDVNRVLRMGCDSHLIYGAPLEIALGLIFLYSLMGWSALVGFSLLALSVPINYWLGQIAVKVARERQTARDARQTALQELINDVRTVKLFGWSAAFIERVEAKRKVELDWLVKDWFIRYAYTLLWASMSLLVPLIAFWSYVKLQGERLTIAVAFTALSLFSLVRGPLNQIPGFGIRILQLRVSISRMESFFAEDEVSPRMSDGDSLATGAVEIEDATLRYAGANDGRAVLVNLDVDFPARQLTIVSGPTGCGKSSLLLGLLGELEVVSGRVDLPPAVSYAAQHPWLESLTVRENILFGYPAHEERYRTVMRACALEKDLKLLPDGDRTFVGERGVSLSGGQKARLALARAVYAPTGVILLDDVFSAVDAHVARHLLTHLFTSPLIRSRTCILVTHHVDLVLPLAAYHVQLKNGRIIAQGPVASSLTQASDTVEEELRRLPDDEEASDGDEDDAAGEPKKERVTAGKVEGWTSGAVKSEMYKAYLRSSGYTAWALVLLSVVGRPIFTFLEQFVLRQWGEAATQQDGTVDTNHYILLYGLVGAGTSILIVLTAVFISLASLLASQSLFRQLLSRVVYAPLRWYDLVPLGTIVNRFTQDIGVVDDGLAVTMAEFAVQMAFLIAALVVISIVLPAALGASLIFALIYSTIFRSYLVVNRDVNRIAATTASPLFASFAEALRGITTIRAFGKQKEYRARLCRIVDETLAFWYCSATLDIWLSIRTQVLSAFCLLTTAIFATFFRVSPGLAGIAITSSQGVLQALDFLCSAYGRLVLSMNSLERITEYVKKVPQEPSGGVVPPANWPSSTDRSNLLEVKDLVMRYDARLPPVLHVVGRTGSGKSTLATSLLRSIEPASGHIIVDALDISHVSLEELRRRITLVPQEATLFEGTLRDNLDPFDEHTDGECIGALRRTHLLDPDVREAVVEQGFEEGRAKPASTISLDSAVAAGGANWSAGQRQLIALSRALLRDSRIVILDESSASLDHALDTKVQQVIREEFRDAAVLTIAHRLPTVIDYDRILVLDAGRIVELDSPDKLLVKEDGVFRRMWEANQGGTKA
ncbi:ATP-binding cassette transporter [Rhodotorula toruloides]|uniref:ATP-binding cassette transporter n=1 Tax=Rhodotorula toruloides TaxID=5286 RepID=A0A511KFI9_RHOTO|nr:ATP-binding cassette transporter [Rhodotorula toruloides]